MAGKPVPQAPHKDNGSAISVRRRSRLACRVFPWRIVCQVFTAIVGGYFFANAASIFLARALPVFRGDAVATGFLLVFIFYTLAVMWVFAHRSLLRGCGMVWLATVILAGLSWGLTMIGEAA